MEKDLQKRIDEALDAANHIKPVSPKPFFYTRLKAKMEQESQRSVLQLVPVSLRVTCSVILFINAVYFFSSSFQKSTNASEQLAAFYQFDSNSVY
jgi:hypothetical protein